ncbi:MAG: hypothetical protein H0U71_03930 [Gammaproteobacteria bacterium]|nr:hypothetical protein [Gammaproteobacteria bacterium]
MQKEDEVRADAAAPGEVLQKYFDADEAAQALQKLKETVPTPSLRAQNIEDLKRLAQDLPKPFNLESGLESYSNFKYQAARVKYTLSIEETRVLNKITGLDFTQIGSKGGTSYKDAKDQINEIILQRDLQNSTHWFRKHIWPKRISHLNLALEYLHFHEENTKGLKNPEERLANGLYRNKKDENSSLEFRKRFSNMTGYFSGLISTNRSLKKLNALFTQKRAIISNLKHEQGLSGAAYKLQLDTLITKNLTSPEKAAGNSEGLPLPRFFQPQFIQNVERFNEVVGDCVVSKEVTNFELLEGQSLTQLSETICLKTKKLAKLNSKPPGTSEALKTELATLREQLDNVDTAYTDLTLQVLLDFHQIKTKQACQQLITATNLANFKVDEFEREGFNRSETKALQKVATMITNIKAAKKAVVKYAPVFKRCILASIQANDLCTSILEKIAKQLSIDNNVLSLVDLLGKAISEVTAGCDPKPLISISDKQALTPEFLNLKKYDQVLVRLQSTLERIKADPTASNEIINKLKTELSEEKVKLTKIQAFDEGRAKNIVDAARDTTRSLVHLADHPTSKFGPVGPKN